MKSLTFLLLLLITLPAASAQQSVVIQNANFEAPVAMGQSNPCGMSSYSIPGWSGRGGVIHWTCGAYQSNVAFLWDSSMTQNLGVLPQSGVYTLKFVVANWFYFYPGHYTASVLIGGNNLCSTSGFPVGDFTQVTLTCPVAGHISTDHGFGLTGNLSLAFVSDLLVPCSDPSGMCRTWPVLIDNVSLTFSPLGAAVALPQPLKVPLYDVNFTFPMTSPPTGCLPADGTCTIQFRACDTSGPAGSTPICVTAPTGTLYIVKVVSQPAMLETDTPVVVITKP